MGKNLGEVKRVRWKNKIKRKTNKFKLKNKISKRSVFLISSFITIFLVFFFTVVITINSKVSDSYALSASEIVEISPNEYLTAEGSGLEENFVTYKTKSSTFKSLDKRVYVLDEYFKSRNSPLYGQAKYFVEACDKYGAPKDCISTTAIARHETDLCNYANSADYHNCMGWGGAGEHRRRYTSFQEHIDIATDVLVNQYGPSYMDDPRLMEAVFCGPQDECIGWGSRVLVFMREIDSFSESLGVGRLTDLRTDGHRY